jgi:hypothetical protein
VEPGGLLAPVRITGIGRAADLVNAFTLAERKVTIAPGDGGQLRALVDGRPPQLTRLEAFQVLAEAGTTWTHAGRELERLSGEPRVASLDDGRLVLEGGTGGYDGVGTGAPSTDLRVAAKVEVSSGSAALLVRAGQGETSLAGVGLILEAKPARARLLSFDGKGKAFELSPWVDLPAAPPGGHSATVEVRGDALTARVGGRTLAASVPAGTLAEGRGALAVLGGGRIQVEALALSAPPPAGKGGRPGAAARPNPTARP